MPGTKQLLPNQVIVKDDNIDVEWIFDVTNEDELDILREYGEQDENGNIVLSYPLVATLKRWSPETVSAAVEERFKDMAIPELKIAFSEEDELRLPDLNNCLNSQLEELLSVYGGYRAYLEAQLAHLDSEKSILENAFEEGLLKMMYSLHNQYKGEKRPVKEVLRGEALQKNPLLKQTRQKMIEIEALYSKVLGMRNSYNSYYQTVSRVVALRLGSREDN